MSYVAARYRKRKEPPNPIWVGCGGTLYLLALYAVSYFILTGLGTFIEYVRPETLINLMALPGVWNLWSVQLQMNQVMLFIEMSVLTMVLLGFTTSAWSVYDNATREKESWELYAEEAERQAKEMKQK